MELTDIEILTNSLVKAYEKDNNLRTIINIVLNGFDIMFIDDPHHIRVLESIVIRRAYLNIIFNHKFAKAFWGEENRYQVYYHKTEARKFPDIETIPEWQYHLQQMVLSDNPIQYLKEFL